MIQHWVVREHLQSQPPIRTWILRWMYYKCPFANQWWGITQMTQNWMDGEHLQSRPPSVLLRWWKKFAPPPLLTDCPCSLPHLYCAVRNWDIGHWRGWTQNWSFSNCIKYSLFLRMNVFRVAKSLLTRPCLLSECLRVFLRHVRTHNACVHTCARVHMWTFMKPLHNIIHNGMRAPIMTGIIHDSYYLSVHGCVHTRAAQCS